ncbi:MAG: hypothetical protein ABIF71_05705 [Planctomycetota bacterium]
MPRKSPLTLPALPPKVTIETREVLKRAIAASRALAELKGLGGILPNQAMLVTTGILQGAKNDELAKSRKSHFAGGVPEVGGN